MNMGQLGERLNAIEHRLATHERQCEERNRRADQLELDVRQAMAASRPWLQIGQAIMTAIAVTLLMWIATRK